MKKIVKYLLVFISLIVIGELLKRTFLKKETPSFVETLYKDVDTNDSLKNIIGGINSYKCNYDESQLKKSDTIFFKAIYEGNTKTLTYEGKCTRYNKGWNIKIDKEKIE